MKHYLLLFIFFILYNYQLYVEWFVLDGLILAMVAMLSFLVGEVLMIGLVKQHLPNKIKVHFKAFTKFFLLFLIVMLNRYFLQGFTSEGIILSVINAFILATSFVILKRGIELIFSKEKIFHSETTTFSIAFNYLYSHCIKSIERIDDAIIYKKDREEGIVKANVKNNTTLGDEEIRIKLKKLTTDEILVQAISQLRENNRDNDYGKNKENVEKIIEYLEENIN